MTDYFWPATQRGLEARLLEIHEGRVSYCIGYEDHYDDPEEQVRAELFCKLILDYKYPRNRIVMEARSSFRRPKYPIDILIFEDDEKTIPFAVIECKKRDCGSHEVEDGIDEAFENAHLRNTGARYRPKYVMFYSHDLSYTWQYGDYDPSQRSLHRVGDLPRRYGAVPSHKYLKEVKERDKESVDEVTIRIALRYCHQVIWHDTKKSSIFAFHEMIKILFATIYDEQSTKVGEAYRFQRATQQSDAQLGEGIKRLFIEAAQSRKELFEQTVTDHRTGQPLSVIASIAVSDTALGKIVDKLERISFANTSFDAKGSAFETIISPIFRGEYGGYFTPRVIVDFMVRVLDAVSPIDIVRERFIDPACGSGGMLIALWNYARTTLIPRQTMDPVRAEHLGGAFAAKHLFGVEIVPDVAQVAMINMILREDGSSNIELGSGVGPFDQYVTGWIKPHSFHGVITNPPFGDTMDDSRTLQNTMGASGVGRSASTKSAALFLLRSVELLEDGGRCVIVLPDSLLNNPSEFSVRKIVREKVRILGVISLPTEVFMSAGASINTSIVILKRQDVEVGDRYGAECDAIVARTNQERDQEVNRVKKMLNRTASDAVKQQLTSRLQYIRRTKWRRILEDRLDTLYRAQNNYPVFLADVESAGIDATGRMKENALPAVVQAFQTFLQESGMPEENSPAIIGRGFQTQVVSFRDFSRWDTLYYRDAYRKNMETLERLFGELKPLSWYFDISPSLSSPIMRELERNEEMTTVPYVEIANVDISDGRIRNLKEVPFYDLPSRAKWVLNPGDLLISTTRPYRGAIAVAETEHAGAIATSGFLVLRPRKSHIQVSAIKTFLRSAFGVLQLEQHMTGGTYPAIGPFEIMERIRIPKLSPGLAERMARIGLAAERESYVRKEHIRAEEVKLGNQGSYLAEAIAKAVEAPASRSGA